MGHDGGGRLTAELVEHLFRPAFGAAGPAGPGDSAVLPVGGTRVAFSTDSYVVQPLFFPGGSIGELAVNGTVNDVAMSDAVRVGDAVLVSGPIGLHGVAILRVRDGLEFGTVVERDTAALGGMVAAMLRRRRRRCTRDPTRGGVAAGLHELATEAEVGIELVE